MKKFIHQTIKIVHTISFLGLLIGLHTPVNAQHSVAREWNEVLLQAIREDFARPTIHGRNLFHSSIAMYDAWAVFDSEATTFLLGKTVDGFECSFDGISMPDNIEEAREEAISYAAYRILRHRYQSSPGAFNSLPRFDNLMTTLGYDINFSSTDYSTGSAAALGNYIAQCIINFGFQDGSREQFSYSNASYGPINMPLIVDFPGNPSLTDPNRWQPLTLDVFIDQSGNPIPLNTPNFLSPEWGRVTPFALKSEDLTIYERDAYDYWVYHDPGTPPYLDLENSNLISDEYKWGFSLVSIWSSHLDPADNVMIDISPASIGNIQSYPTSLKGYRSFYKLTQGGDVSPGHAINPTTGQAYEPQIVPRADYARVLAEFWADGPDSETPPGHWFTILNYVNDHPDIVRKFKGTGPVLGELEWDVKAYFALGGAVHDAAVTAWGIKGWYDYLRPISAIRFMADQGQSSDADAPNYHPAGIPLEPGYIELVLDANDPLAGANGEHIGKIKLKSWKGPDYINNPATDVAGVDWILAENWWPYQRPSFVTPPFAGYISGHSTFSRAAAEVLTQLTGDPFFPGGMAEFKATANEFLVFEEGPSQDITLQWATYRDASDQTSLSRIWGGIHPPVDDIPGRLIGIDIGNDAFDLAESYFYKDEDNDGFYSFEDCNDNNASVNPSVPEQCNNIDNDCNGLIDDGLQLFTYYLDSDTDGFGDLNFTSTVCATTPPNGYVTNSDDCNDSEVAINPISGEICDGIDNDCNGLIDDGLETTIYFRDMDNDGFGNANITVDTCLSFPPDGYVANQLDCDDNNPNLNPNIDEICDGIDNDCNGIIDDGLQLFTYFRDADEDSFGDPLISLDTCRMTPPTGYVVDNSDCNDTNENININATEVCDGIDNDCNGIIDDGLQLFTYFRDADEDNFGDPLISLDTCRMTPPTGYVVDNSDCNDTNENININATEVCDGIDNDCNGIIDDGLEFFRYYVDTDEDAFGDIAFPIDTCLSVPPTGYVIDSTDCNDSNAGIFPGALDIPDNDIDEDCSGVDLFKLTKVFPNPVKDVLSIHFDYMGELIIQIFDVDGRLVIQEEKIFEINATNINMSNLAQGVYILRILNLEEQDQLHQKIVKY